MTTKTTKSKKVPKTPMVRRAFIPLDLTYLSNTEFGRTMLGLAEEIAQEQGKRSTEEIEQLLNLMRGVSHNTDLP